MRLVTISAHAVDRASTRCLQVWSKTRKGKEGLHTWLTRMSEKLLATAPNEIRGDHHFYHFKGIRFVFTIGSPVPILKTIMMKDVDDE